MYKNYNLKSLKSHSFFFFLCLRIIIKYDFVRLIKLISITQINKNIMVIELIF